MKLSTILTATDLLESIKRYEFEILSIYSKLKPLSRAINELQIIYFPN